MSADAISSFEGQRTHLLSIAYRMLGEMSAAEDVVQEAWLRWQRTEHETVRDVRAWLSAATVRLALDALRKVRTRRETYVGPWLPEPILPDDMRAFAADAPAAHAELASDLSLALLHVLERLSPEERAAFILHDAFDCGYAEIAATLDKTEAACRKLVSRARERVKQDRPRYSVPGEQHRTLVARFLEAAAQQDSNSLGALLAPDVIFYSDGGGRVPAAINPVSGHDKVLRLMLGLIRKMLERANPDVQIIDINGRPGVVVAWDAEVYSAFAFEAEDERITGIYAVRNPEKLTRIERVLSVSPLPSPSAGRSPPPAGSKPRRSTHH
jgi:RNA polymerase sigma-70 factor (ECF subfamily)